MSSRKGAKAKPGAGKATKKKQPAQKASQVPAKNPSTSTSKKSDKPSSDRFDSDQSPVSPASDLQGRGDKKKGTSEAKAVGSQYSTSHIPSQPLMYALKKTESQENPFIPTSEVPRGPANQMVLQQKPSMTSRKYEQTVFNQSGKREGDEALPPNNLFRHEEEGYHSAIASQLTEAIASGLAQADASFQTKTNLLQQMIETSNKKTERAVGQVCHSVNRVKINLEIVDSTLEMMNTRLLEFQQGVRSGLKELTKEVGNLAFSLAQKATGNQKNLNELCANNQQADEVCFNQPFPGPTWYSS